MLNPLLESIFRIIISMSKSAVNSPCNLGGEIWVGATLMGGGDYGRVVPPSTPVKKEGEVLAGLADWGAGCERLQFYKALLEAALSSRL